MLRTADHKCSLKLAVLKHVECNRVRNNFGIGVFLFIFLLQMEKNIKMKGMRMITYMFNVAEIDRSNLSGEDLSSTEFQQSAGIYTYGTVASPLFLNFTRLFFILYFFLFLVVGKDFGSAAPKPDLIRAIHIVGSYGSILYKIPALSTLATSFPLSFSFTEQGILEEEGKDRLNIMVANRITLVSLSVPGTNFPFYPSCIIILILDSSLVIFVLMWLIR